MTGRKDNLGLHLLVSSLAVIAAFALWDSDATSWLALLLQRSASVLVIIGVALSLGWRAELRDGLKSTFGIAVSRNLAIVLTIAAGLSAAAAQWLSTVVTADDLKASGFVSLDAYRDARALGFNDAANYQAYQHTLSEKAAQAAAAARHRQELASIRDAEQERLVTGRWVLPIDRSGEIVTIRHNGNAFEALVQSERGQQATYGLTKSHNRYKTNDDFGTYCEVLPDGRLQIGDAKGLADSLDILRARPRNSAEVDAAIQAAFEAAQAAHSERVCREDANCWGERFRLQALPMCVFFIEHAARYDFRWTDGWGTEKFVAGAQWHGHKGNTLGLVDYVGNKLMLQNGFGAWQNVICTCTFDTHAEAVVDVQSRAGRLFD